MELRERIMMTWTFRTFGTALAAVACAGLTLAPTAAAQQQPSQPPSPDLQTQSLEELMSLEVASVYGASKREQLVTDAPSAVSIITAQDIATFGWRTLADVLKSVRGFYVTNDRNYSYLGAQGFGRPTDYNNRVLFLLDGHRVNDNIYDAALIGTEFPIDVDLIERIEVIRGPGSALYGTSAFFGVVNVITKTGASVGGAEASLELGSDQQIRARASYGKATSDHQFLLSATRYSSAGAGRLYYPEYDDPLTNFGVANGHDGDSAGTVYASWRSATTVAQGLFSQRAKEVPTGSWWVEFNDPRSKTRDSRGWLDVSHRLELGGTQLTARAAYDHMSYLGTYPFENDNVQRDFAQGDWVSGELLADRTLTTRVRVVGGVEVKSHLNQDQWAYYTLDPDTAAVDARHSSWQYAGYAQADITINRALTVVAGARYDWWSTLDGTARPRLGVILRPLRDGTIKILHGGAFRAPSAYERFYFGSQEATLRPEDLRTSEAVYEQHIGRRLRLTASTFMTSITDLISQIETNEQISHVNDEQVDSHGGALETEMRWATGALVRVGYAYQHVLDKDSGQWLSNAPRHLLTTAASTPFLGRRGTAGLDLTRVSSRLTNQESQLPGAWLANMTVNYRLAASRLTLAGSLNNLFDTDYAHPVGGEFRQAAITQNGRTFSIRALMRF
jgi:outer membrane receptor for ferrienterochelin and colicins